MSGTDPFAAKDIRQELKGQGRSGQSWLRSENWKIKFQKWNSTYTQQSSSIYIQNFSLLYIEQISFITFVSLVQFTFCLPFPRLQVSSLQYFLEAI